MITIEITNGESIKDRLKSRKGKVSTTERGSGWVRSRIPEQPEHALRTHPLPRGGIDFIPS